MAKKKYNFNGEVITLPYTFKGEDGKMVSTSSEEYIYSLGATDYVEPTPTEEELAEQKAEAYVTNKESDISVYEKMELLASTLTEDKTNKSDDGTVFTKPVIKDGVIVYVDNGERQGSGTYDDPLQFVDGDSVEEGKYYCRCKISAKGVIARQLTEGTYKCIMSADAPTWKAITAFEFAY